MIRKHKLGPGDYRLTVSFPSGAAPRVFFISSRGGRAGWYIREGGIQHGGASHTLRSAIQHVAQMTGQGAYAPGSA